MASNHVGTAEVESVFNQSVAADGSAFVRNFARNDDGTIEVTVEFTPEDSGAREPTAADAKPEPESPDGGASDADVREALAREAVEGGAADAKGEPESPDGDEDTCGGECADGTPCEFTPGDACPHHAGESADAKGDGESPDGAVGYVREYGPCVAAKGADTQTPCGYGANEDGRFCGRHSGMDAPALSTAAVRAREAWESGDTDAVRQFVEEYVA